MHDGYWLVALGLAGMAASAFLVLLGIWALHQPS